MNSAEAVSQDDEQKSQNQIKPSSSKLTEEDLGVHVDERGHGEEAGGEGRMEDLADGVVQHVGRVEPHVRHLDLRGVVPHGGLGLHELGDVEGDGDDGHRHHVHGHAAARSHGRVQVPGLDRR